MENAEDESIGKQMEPRKNDDRVSKPNVLVEIIRKIPKRVGWKAGQQQNRSYEIRNKTGNLRNKNSK